MVSPTSQGTRVPQSPLAAHHLDVQTPLPITQSPGDQNLTSLSRPFPSGFLGRARLKDKQVPRTRLALQARSPREGPSCEAPSRAAVLQRPLHTPLPGSASQHRCQSSRLPWPRPAQHCLPLEGLRSLPCPQPCPRLSFTARPKPPARRSQAATLPAQPEESSGGLSPDRGPRTEAGASDQGPRGAQWGREWRMDTDTY